jgi:hypothetical protein
LNDVSLFHSISWLAAFGAVTLVLLVHWLAPRRVEIVELPTVRFLLNRDTKTRNRFRWLRSLLLWSRIALVLLLLVLLARPLLSGSESLVKGKQAQEWVIAVDVSLSMETTSGGESSLDRARTVVTRLLQEASDTQRITLLLIGESPVTLVSDLPRSKLDPTEVVQRIQAVPVAANHYLALQTTGGGLKPSQHRILITDLQQNGFRELLSARESFPKGTSLQIIDVGSRSRTNRLSLEQMPLADQTILSGLPLLLRPTVQNFSEQPESATLRLSINDEEVQRRPLRLAPKERREELFSWRPLKPGSYSARLELILDEGRDPYPFDDQHHFGLTVRRSLSLLILNDGESSRPYVRSALESSQEIGPSLTRTEPTVKLREQSETRWLNLNETELDRELASTELLILDGVTDRLDTPRIRSAVRRFVESGGGLILFPSESFARSVGKSSWLDLNWGMVRESASTLNLGSREAIRFRRMIPLQPQSPRVQILHEFSDRSPALLSLPWDRGRVLVAAFPLDPEWTNLPLRGHDFVPWIYSLLETARPQAEFQVPSAVVANEPFTLSLRNPDTLELLWNRDGKRTPLTLERVNGMGQIRLEPPHPFGRSQLETTRSGQKETTWLGVNPPTVESDFRRVEIEELKSCFPPGSVEINESFGEPSDIVRQELRELSRVLAILLLLLLGVEFLLSTPVRSDRSSSSR